MAEASKGASNLSDAEIPNLSDKDLLRQFQERLGFSDSDSEEDEEFHDACGDVMPRQSDYDLKQALPEACESKCAESRTVFSDCRNDVHESSDGEENEFSDVNLNPLPSFSDIKSSQPVDQSTTLPGGGTNNFTLDPSNQEHSEESTQETELDINVDEIVQEAVEGGAAMEDEPEQEVIVDEEQILKDLEATWSEEEKEDKKAEAQELKNSGNTLFKQGCYEEAKEQYSAALALCPTCFPKDRSIIYSNRAACKMREEGYEDAIKDCTKALELNPGYLKCILRRAELHEKTEKLDEALVDYQKVLEIDPTVHTAREACMRLPDQIKERNEKLKEEMMGKLKDLGNMILKPFGLSTENFQMNQDPNSGGYSVNFKR